MRRVLLFLVVAQALDWAMTEFAVRVGLIELNPVMRALVWPALGAGALGVKLALVLALVLALRWLPPLRLNRWAVIALTAGSWGLVGYDCAMIVSRIII